MAEESVKAVYYKEKNIGNWLKKSKKQYIWKLEVDGDLHCIEFLDSILSGKKKIIKNGLIVFERQLFGVPFQYPFNIGKHSLNIAMHGDKYELRVDGMSFSHLYNLTKSQNYGNDNYEEEDDDDNDMGAYGDDVSGSSHKKSSYDEPHIYENKKEVNKDDPFAWDNPKPSSKKFEPYSKPKKSFDDFEDTGYDGWNDVKRSVTEVVKNMPPDPYAKQGKRSTYDPYPEDDYLAHKSKNEDSGYSRSKATTVVGKQNDFFSGNFAEKKPANKDEFNKNSQPKVFDFNDFGKTVEEKPKQKKDEFDNIFSDAPKVKKEDDPFSWGNDGGEKITKKAGKNEAFDFDFNLGAEKKSAIAKTTADDLFNDPPKAKEEKFDPFAEDTTNSSEPINNLEGIKFDYPPPEPVISEVKVESEPVIENETIKEEPQRDPSDPWAKKELFNLGNLSKGKKSKVEETNKLESAKFGTNPPGFGVNTSNQFSSVGFGNPIPSTKVPETKEEKLNALESAFGSTEIKPQPQPQPVEVSTGNTNNKPNNDDFGDFPSMFGSTPEGFGNFQGFESEGFSNTKDPFESKPADKPQPAKKNDDWFEF